MAAQTVAVALCGIAAIWFGWRVFRTRSMVRSALSLLGSMAALGGLFLALEAEFLGVLQLMMMGTEMAIMAIFMVMFMMDPGGLGQMEMTHQKRLSGVAGLVAGLAAGVLAIRAGWGAALPPVAAPGAQNRLLGLEIMGRSMLIFETIGVMILTAMIAATAVAIRRRR